MKILITGASRGIGLAETKKLNREGNELFLVATSANSFKDPTSQNVHLLAHDLANQREIKALANEVKSKTTSLDVLINNVGVMMMKRFEHMNEGEINSMLDINLRSHILLTHELLPLLKKGTNPHLIFMSSMAAKSNIVGESVYSATKAAVTNFANVLRNEMGNKMKISTIHSWGVNTFNSDKPGLLLKPENIAEVVEFILSRDALFQIESIEVSNINQWRGGEAPWSPK